MGTPMQGICEPMAIFSIYSLVVAGSVSIARSNLRDAVGVQVTIEHDTERPDLRGLLGVPRHAHVLLVSGSA